MRSVDEIADALLDAQEEWRRVMRECDAKVDVATRRFQDAVLSAEKEAGLDDEPLADAIGWPRAELVSHDPGDVSVQFKEAIARKRERR